MRLKPSYIIAGGVKCASSSLYRYLIEHPSILPCQEKEPTFFATHNILRLIKNFNRYKRLFPDTSKPVMKWNWVSLTEGKFITSQHEKEIIPNQKYITGEANATNFCYAKPKYVKWLLPKVKVIVLLRDPSKRFYSHFRMFKRFHELGRNGYDIDDFEAFVKEEIEKFNNNQKTRILHQGLYAMHLDGWKKSFKEHLLIIKTSDLQSENVQTTLDNICDFLSVSKYNFDAITKKRFNNSSSKKEENKGMNILNSFYEPYNVVLKEKYGVEFE